VEQRRLASLGGRTGKEPGQPEETVDQQPSEGESIRLITHEYLMIAYKPL
jgi:hypothetical protein